MQPQEMMMDRTFFMYRMFYQALVTDFVDSNSLSYDEPTTQPRKSIHNQLDFMSEDDQLAAAIAASIDNELAKNPIVIDDNEPHILPAKERSALTATDVPTTIQFRLPDGKRIVHKFAKTDKIQVLFEHLRAVLPDEQRNTPFELVFQRELLSQSIDFTLADRNILGAALNVEFA
jgi:hypothetical protein